MPHVAQKTTPNRYTHTTTTQRAAPRGVTAPAAYRLPISSIMAPSPSPPEMADVRRSHLSASMKPGMDTANMTMELTPDATSDESVDVMPA